MGDVTKIAWTDATFNPWVGCQKVAAGCLHCYAEADFDKRRRFAAWGPNGTRVVTSPANWQKPRKWDRDAAENGTRSRVFCSSLADVFEAWDGDMLAHSGNSYAFTTEGGWCGPAKMDDVRRQLFRLIDATPNLDWQLLTKRPENIRRMWHLGGIPNPEWCGRSPEENAQEWASRLVRTQLHRHNTWLGTSIACQEDADRNVVRLRALRDLSPVLFLSVEPLIAPVLLELDGIDWVIVGGESGPNARPCNLAWIRSIVEQCKAAGVSVFVKQLGANVFDPASSNNPKNLKDKKGGDISEWPEDLRVREFPVVAESLV